MKLSLQRYVTEAKGKPWYCLFSYNQSIKVPSNLIEVLVSIGWDVTGITSTALTKRGTTVSSVLKSSGCKTENKKVSVKTMNNFQEYKSYKKKNELISNSIETLNWVS